MKFYGFALVAALLLPLVGQEAKIIIVERRDTDRLKAAYSKFKTAQKEWESVKTEVAKNYTTESGKTMEGWERVEFSVDFRALVPSRSLSTTWHSGSGTVLTNGGLTSLSTYVATPAIGSTGTINASGAFVADDVSVNPDLKTKEK